MIMIIVIILVMMIIIIVIMIIIIIIIIINMRILVVIVLVVIMVIGREIFSGDPWGQPMVQSMLDQLLAFDVSLAKPNCYEPHTSEGEQYQFLYRAWICERLHGGQRLVHSLAAGVPTIVWGGSQGFLDVVAPAPDWPVALTNEEMVELLADVLSNRTLRCALAEEAVRLAEPFHLFRIVERYALAFDDLLRDPPVPPPRRGAAGRGRRWGEGPEDVEIKHIICI